jgi:hypothetical protein
MPRLPAPPSIPSRADTLCSSVPAATRGADIAMLAVSSAAATLAITLRWCESGTLGSASCPENPAPNIHRPRRGGFGAATPATSPPFGRSSKKNSASRSRASVSCPEKNETSRSMREDLSVSIISASPAACRAPIIATECSLAALLRATVAGNRPGPQRRVQFLLRISSPASSTCVLMTVLLLLDHGGDRRFSKLPGRQILDRIVVRNLNSKANAVAS